MRKFTEQSIAVKAQLSTMVNFVYQSPQGRRSAHEIEKNPRFGLELLKEGEEIIPSKRRQIP
jgi:energy-coupling factor transporter ATP-binding protein EcfA2